VNPLLAKENPHKSTKDIKDYSFRPHSISVEWDTGGKLSSSQRWLAEVHKDPGGWSIDEAGKST